MPRRRLTSTCPAHKEPTSRRTAKTSLHPAKKVLANRRGLGLESPSLGD
jgi:hypothetical protein